MYFKPGDKVLRILPPSENWMAWVGEGTVLDETDEHKVVCDVLVDGYRRMEFSQSNGLCLSGTESFIIKQF
jgi:hypothetical protein